MIGYIYTIISPSGKKYIGQTRNLVKRKSEYKRMCKKQAKSKIYRSVNKYGWDAHRFDIMIEYHGDSKMDTVDFLNRMEEYFIVKLDTLHNGLNSIGGGSSRCWTDEQKAKMSELKKLNPSRYWLGKNRSDDVKEKLRMANLGKVGTFKGKKHTEAAKVKCGLANRGKGKAHTPETRLKISLSHKGKIISDEQKEKNRLARLGKTLTPEQKVGRKKMFSHLVGIKRGDETCKKISKSKIGHTVSEETREKIRQKLKGNIPHNKGKKAA